MVTSEVWCKRLTGLKVLLRTCVRHLRCHNYFQKSRLRVLVPELLQMMRLGGWENRVGRSVMHCIMQMQALCNPPDAVQVIHTEYSYIPRLLSFLLSSTARVGRRHPACAAQALFT